MTLPQQVLLSSLHKLPNEQGLAQLIHLGTVKNHISHKNFRGRKVHNSICSHSIHRYEVVENVTVHSCEKNIISTMKKKKGKL